MFDQVGELLPRPRPASLWATRLPTPTVVTLLLLLLPLLLALPLRSLLPRLLLVLLPPVVVRQARLQLAASSQAPAGHLQTEQLLPLPAVAPPVPVPSLVVLLLLPQSLDPAG